ncbi:MAG: hypothetical protein ACYDEJ_15125, partial [Desulfitobacteriaceae bacterium]
LQNGLKQTAYHYWVRRFKILEQQEAEENKFVEIILPFGSKNITKETRPIDAKLILSFGDYSIGVEDDFNATTLAELVKVLRKL